MSNDPFADIRDKRIGELNEEQKDRATELWLREQIGPSEGYWHPLLKQVFRVIDRLREFDVRKIMLDVVPGEDGMGHEVFAKSVDEVVNKLSEMGERLADLEDSPTAQAEAAQPVADWLHLKPYGYAPGNYMSKCHRCGSTPIMDKRAVTCRPCAEAMAAAPQPTEAAQPVEPLTRFCPGCGSVGPVPAKFRDCCPDGSHARMVPKSLAKRCHDLFQLALRAPSDPDEVLAAPQPAEAAPKPNSSATEAGARAQADAHLRALHWVRDGDKNCRHNNWVAETPLGRILITWKGWKEDHYATIDEFPGAELGVVGDPDELRDLAESEFWRRVDALAAQPQQPAPERAACLPFKPCVQCDTPGACIEHGTGKFCPTTPKAPGDDNTKGCA